MFMFLKTYYSNSFQDTRSDAAENIYAVVILIIFHCICQEIEEINLAEKLHFFSPFVILFF